MEWREVRRRKPIDTPARRWDNNSTVSSFFVSNIPGDVTRKELWDPCAKLGKVVDVYIAGRRSASGGFFAFVRYVDVLDVEALEKELNNVRCRGRKIAANCAKHPRSVSTVPLRKVPAADPVRVAPANRDSRMFVDVAKGEEKKKATEVLIHGIADISDWMDKSVLVAEAKNFDSLCNLPSLLAIEGYDAIEVKYAGGLNSIIKFKSEKAAEIFKANKCIWLKWFNGVEFIGKKIWRFERIAWLKIVGVPIMGWDESNFNSIAASFGKVLENRNSFWNSMDISHGKVCVLTAARKRINEEINVLIKGESMKVGILEVEDDWAPYNPFIASALEDSEDDEAVSDTWDHEKMDLEDGEIDPMEDARKPNSPEKLPSNSDERDDQTAHASTHAVHVSENNCVSKEKCEENIDSGNTLNAQDGPASAGSKTVGRENPGGPPSVGLSILRSNHSPIPVNTYSSPEFEVGESIGKRRRTKKKGGRGQRSSPIPTLKIPSHSSSSVGSLLETKSIDLNKEASGTHGRHAGHSTIGSTSRSSSSSSDVAKTIAMGLELGFQIGNSDPAFMEAINGGGVNKFVDSGCSRHMTGDISHLHDIQNNYDGYVSFAGEAKKERSHSWGPYSTVC
ncbi:hypothetical protein LXL04_020891 [Taraxacum kok-saghyz]